MRRIATIILICLTLPGCATLTIATIGAAVGVGLVAGAGRFAGENIARYEWRQWKRHVAYRKCRQYWPNQLLVERCARRYAPEYF